MSKISFLCYVSSVYIITLLTYINCDKIPYYIGDTVVEMETDHLPVYKPVLDLLKKELPGRKRLSTRPLSSLQLNSERPTVTNEKNIENEKNISSKDVINKSKDGEENKPPSRRQAGKPFEKVNKKDIIVYLKKHFKSNLFEDYLLKNRNNSSLDNILNKKSNKYPSDDQFEFHKDVSDLINNNSRRKKIIVMSPKRNTNADKNNKYMGNSEVINVHNFKVKIPEGLQSSTFDLSPKIGKLTVKNIKKRSEETNLVKNSDDGNNNDNSTKTSLFHNFFTSQVKNLGHSQNTNTSLVPSVYKDIILTKDINIYDSRTGYLNRNSNNLSQTNDPSQIQYFQVTKLNSKDIINNISEKATEKDELNAQNSNVPENAEHQEFAHPKAASNHHVINQNQEYAKPTKLLTQEYTPQQLTHVSHPSKQHITTSSQEYVPPKVSHVSIPNQEYVPPKISHTSHSSKSHITIPSQEYVPPKVSHVSIPNQEYVPPKIFHTSHPSKPHITIPNQEYVPPKVSHVSIPNQEYVPPKISHTIHPSKAHITIPSQEYVPPKVSHVDIPNQEYIPPKISHTSHLSKPHITTQDQKYVPPKISNGHQSVSIPNQVYVPPKITQGSHLSKPHITVPSQEYIPPKISNGHQSNVHINIPNQEYIPPKISHTNHPSKPHITIPNEEYIPPKIASQVHPPIHPVNIQTQQYIPPNKISSTPIQQYLQPNLICTCPSKDHVANPIQTYLPPNKITSSAHPSQQVSPLHQEYLPPKITSASHSSNQHIPAPDQEYLPPKFPSTSHSGAPNQIYVPPNKVLPNIPSQEYLPPAVSSGTSHLTGQGPHQNIVTPSQQYHPPSEINSTPYLNIISQMTEAMENFDNFFPSIQNDPSINQGNHNTNKQPGYVIAVPSKVYTEGNTDGNCESPTQNEFNNIRRRRRNFLRIINRLTNNLNRNRNRNQNGRPNRNKNKNSNSQGGYFGKAITFPILGKKLARTMKSGKVSKVRVEDDANVIPQLKVLEKYIKSLIEAENHSMFNESIQNTNRSRNIVRTTRSISNNLDDVYNKKEKPLKYLDENEDHLKKTPKKSPKNRVEKTKNKNSDIIYIKTFRRELPPNLYHYQILSNKINEHKTNAGKPLLNDNSKMFQVISPQNQKIISPITNNPKGKHHKILIKEANKKTNYLYQVYPKSREVFGNNDKNIKPYKDRTIKASVNGKFVKIRIENSIKDENRTDKINKNDTFLTHLIRSNEWVSEIPKKGNKDIPKPIKDDPKSQIFNSSQISKLTELTLERPNVQRIPEQLTASHKLLKPKNRTNEESYQELDSHSYINQNKNHILSFTLSKEYQNQNKNGYFNNDSSEEEEEEEKEEEDWESSEEDEEDITSSSDEHEDMISSDEHEDYSEYEGFDEIIERNYTVRRISFTEYNMTAFTPEQACRCGAPQSNRIIGGTPTTILKYPWMVQQVFKEGRVVYCGGTIINDLYILTAAHCVIDTRPEEIYVKIGHTSPELPGTDVEVHSFIIHRRYKNHDVTKYDIALIKLMEPLTFSEKVLPICLPSREYFNNEKGFITGWGTVSEFVEQTSEVLQAASVTIYEYQTCRRKSSYDDIDINKLVICASEKDIDSCQGDSGGPLVYFDGESYSQVGITSWGIGCGRLKFPGVYTKVSPYYRWIRLRTRDATYCKAAPQDSFSGPSTTQFTQSLTTDTSTTTTTTTETSNTLTSTNI